MKTWNRLLNQECESTRGARLLKLLAGAGVILLATLSTAGASILTVHNPSVYDANTAAMDAALGLTGSFTFENFESLSTGAPPATLPSGITLSRTSFAQVGDDTVNTRFWAGSKFLESRWDLGALTFTLPSGVETIGVGFGGNQSDIQISVNGGSWTTISADTNYVSNNTGRNAYVTVQNEAGDPLITSFAYRVTLNTTDWTGVDHIAFGTAAAVPEASEALIVLLGATCLVTGRRRKR